MRKILILTVLLMNLSSLVLGFPTGDTLQYSFSAEVLGETIDSSGNDNNGTTSATFNIGGPNGNGYYTFDGIHDSINVTSVNNFLQGNTTNFTINMWVNLKDFGTDYYDLIDWDNGNSCGFEWRIANGDTRTQLIMGNGTTGLFEQSATGVLSYNQWQMISLVWYSDDGIDQKVTYYWNGTAGSTDTFDTGFTFISCDPTENLYIGSNEGSQRFLNGSVTQVSIWNRTLTTDEIAEQYRLHKKLYINKTSGTCSDAYTHYENDASQPYCTLSAARNAWTDGDDVIISGNGNYTGYFTLTNKELSYGGSISVHPGDQPRIGRIISTYDHPNSEWTNASTGLSGYCIWRDGYLSTVNDFVLVEGDTNLSLFTYSTIYSDMNTLALFNRSDTPEGIYFNASQDIIFLKYLNCSYNPNNHPLFIQKDTSIIEMNNVTGAEFKIENMTLYAPQKGIYIQENSSNITIRNVKIIGGLKGIDVRETSNHLTITNNTIWMQLRQNSTTDTAWNDWKGSAMENTAIWLQEIGSNIEVLRNKVSGYFNGILQYNTATGLGRYLNISHNILSHCKDDCIELEDYAYNAEVSYNNVTDSSIAISISPTNSSQGISRIHHNILIANVTTFFTRPATSYSGECFKIIASDPVTNLLIDHNTCYGRGIYTTTSNSDTQFNTTWKDNIFYSDDEYFCQKCGTDEDSVMYDYNLYYRADNGFLMQYWGSDTINTIFSSLVTAKASGQDNNQWDNNSINSNPLFIDAQGFVLTPYSISPVCSAASDGGDIGALPCSAATTNITFFMNLTGPGTMLSDFNVSYRLASGGSWQTLQVNGTNGSVLMDPYATYEIQGIKSSYYQDSFTKTIGTSPETIVLNMTEAGVMVYIYDEANGSLILEDIDITIYGENGTHYTRNTSTGTLYMNFIPLGTYNITFSSSTYTPRTYILTVSNYTITYMNAYLMKNTLTMIMTVVDIDTQRAIESALVTITKYINDTETVIAALPTDITGRILFAYGISTHYNFYVTHPDYVSREFELNPIKFSSYTVNMEKSLTISNEEDFAGVSLFINPHSYSMGINNVSVLLTAPYGNLATYQINISYPGGTQTYTGSSVYGELKTFTLNISGAAFLDTVNYTIVYQLTGHDQKVYDYNFPINVNSTDGTMAGIDPDADGLGLLERIIIVTFLTIAIGGTASAFLGAEAGLVTVMLMFVLFSRIGLVHPLVIAIPIIAGLIYLTVGGRV